MWKNACVALFSTPANMAPCMKTCVLQWFCNTAVWNERATPAWTYIIILRLQEPPTHFKWLSRGFQQGYVLMKCFKSELFGPQDG